MPDLDALFRPRAVALVGASPDKTLIRGRIVDAVTLHGFDGPLYAVSRSHDEIAGIACYPSVEALPGPVDLAIVTIPAEHVAATLRACGKMGVKAAIVISSGFGEERGDAGAARQRAITDIAREFGMAVLGPNAEGFLNNRITLAATFSPAVVHVENGLRPEASRGRGIAVVSQSGGIGFSFFHRGRPKALDFSYVVSTGNEAALDAMDVAAWLVEDDETAVVLAFLEGVRAPGKLLRVAARAASLGKPLVFAKVGRSEAAAAAAASHTASLAGTARSYDAVFRRYGILPGEDQDHMVDVAAAFAFFADRLPKGTRVGILTPSGGAGAWLADVCEHHGLTVPVLDARTRAAIDRMLPAYGASRNPVDVTAQVIFTVGYAPPLELLANAPGIDAVLVAGVALARPLHRARLRAPRPHRPVRGQAGDLLRLYARRPARGRAARPGRVPVHDEHGERGEVDPRDERVPRVPRTVRRFGAAGAGPARWLDRASVVRRRRPCRCRNGGRGRRRRRSGERRWHRDR